MAYEHLMVDIETLGTQSNSVILSIAAVNFDLDNGRTGERFYQNIALRSSMDMGLVIDPDTLKWWLQQDKGPLAASLTEERNLSQVLADFISFCKNLGQDNLKVWGNAARFDLGLVENACNRAGLLLPWKYYDERDVRTLAAFAPQIKEAIPFRGNKHHPLDDCLYQIRYCTEIWKSLKPQTHAKDL